MASEIEASVREEVERLHAFISGWFRGEVSESNALFEASFASRLAPELINIQPAGAVLTRAELMEGIRAGYGANPDFRITISEVMLRWSSAAGEARVTEEGVHSGDVGGDSVVALATYREFQEGAKQTVPPDNTRVTTVLMRLGGPGEGPLWLHLHETRV